ncbi:hypothetical protein [Piscinibacter sp. XHJ-5]|uniref:hypothetical protein n=1 Tax=Piscinibacter sp. XHJ-5 TaxID=3037797 RepID=UPI0024530308|nr:hypothetical protein [Piscinibacter sp. XHJ-5]
MKSDRARQTAIAALVLGLGVAAGAVHAQSAVGRSAMANPVIYPAREQSPRQQDQDKYECYDWAKRQSGFDPAQTSPPVTTAAAPPTSSGGATGAMVRGAAGGAAVAELSHHDAGRGAAVGVLGSTVMQRAKERQAAQSGQQQMAEQQAAREQLRAIYGRAFAACLEARGYVVK